MNAALANGAAGVPVPLVARKLPFRPYLRRFANGAVMLDAGRFQRLWDGHIGMLQRFCLNDG